MSLLKIARLGHPAIRRSSRPVPIDEINSKDFQKLIDDMVETMRDADGVGIAAPQVHKPKQVIVIEVSKDNPRYPQQDTVPLTVIINPQIVIHGSETDEMWEGCLSVPDLRGRVSRYTTLTLAGINRHGKSVQIEARGFFARVIQHEVDHLKGKVFLDRLANFSTLTHLREYQKYWQENSISNDTS